MDTQKLIQHRIQKNGNQKMEIQYGIQIWRIQHDLQCYNLNLVSKNFLY